MPKLFISHASEDKDAFVRPLALALREHFEVWFDEFELKLGDSLRSRIDHGLRTCDFGVVVLSQAFFSKKWTVSEVNGLFALEDANRKIILPIWYEVGEKEVRDFSPILADRMAVTASKGLERVVEEIKVAVEISEHAHEVFVPDQARRALSSMMEQILGYELDETVLRSQAAEALVCNSLRKIEQYVWDRLQTVNLPDKQRFAKDPRSSCFRVHGPFSIGLTICEAVGYVNSASRTRIVATVFLGPSDLEPPREQETLQEMSWFPTCLAQDKLGYKPVAAVAPDKRHYKTDPDSPALPEKAVATDIVQMLCWHVTQRVRTKRNG